MIGKRTAIVATGMAGLVVLAIVLLVVLITSQRATAQTPPPPGTPTVTPAATPIATEGALPTPTPATTEAVSGVGSTMQARVDQVIKVLREGKPCEAVEAAIDEGMETLYGGMRQLPTKDVPETLEFDKMVGGMEVQLASALDRFAMRTGCGDLHGRALDLKLFIEQMNEVANVVGKITLECGVDDPLDDPQHPCYELRRVLDEDTGEEMPVGETPDRTAQPILPPVLHPSYSVKLRSPFVPPWFRSRTWEENVVKTEPIAPGECVVVFKETRGLMLKLHLDRIIVVTDPWPNRGAKIPIWRLEWVPAEFVKGFNLCNTDGKVVTTVTQRVKQDIPLTYFWRFYPRGGGIPRPSVPSAP